MINNSTSEESSSKISNCCHDIGNLLRVLEKGAPLTQLAEKHIGLIKDVV